MLLSSPNEIHQVFLCVHAKHADLDDEYSLQQMLNYDLYAYDYVMILAYVRDEFLHELLVQANDVFPVQLSFLHDVLL